MSKNREFGITKGYSFLFEDEGKEIRAWFSALTGLEKVYVDGELVSTQRNLSTNSSNHFSIGPNEYSTNLSTTSILKGPFVCTLRKNGQDYKRQKLVFPVTQRKSRELPFVVQITLFIVLGVLFGFARSFWQLPMESIFLFVAVICVLVFVYERRKYKGLVPVIEDEKVA